jgi:hypothetical protein
VSPVFAEVRAACARVAERARHVAIDAAALDALAARVAAEPSPPAIDPAHHALPDPAHTLAFVITLDAINFGSGWFPLLAKRPGRSGYLTIAAALRERFAREGPWDVGSLRALDADACARVLGQAPGGPAAELMELYARALSDLGALLDARFGGSFAALVAEARQSAAALVGILCEMPLYRDVAGYAGAAVPFYKRAQITASDLHEAFAGDGPGRFEDIDELTLFADNLVPHVLRREGVLRYTPELAGRIDREELLEAGSEEEVEIRACALQAVELCVAALRRRGVAATARQLDHRLWNRGQLADMKAHPRHRTRTVYY